MRNVVSYTNSAVDYVSLDEIRKHLRILDADEDSFLEGLINAAFDIASEYVGFSLRKASVEYWFDNSQTTLVIPSRVISVTSVQYMDENGALQSATYNTLGRAYGSYTYEVVITDAPSSVIETGDVYKVIVTEGFELPAASVNQGFKMPDAIKSAIYMIVTNLYENRQDEIIGTIVETLPMNSKFLLNPYKIMLFV